MVVQNEHGHLFVDDKLVTLFTNALPARGVVGVGLTTDEIVNVKDVSVEGIVLYCIALYLFTCECLLFGTVYKNIYRYAMFLYD